ncbi:prolyl-tRNA synthetase [Caloranaerobacter azorensis H53214]|uniref:Proline--tRNA ligase n=1 Tax=Caloranaerobacter azorensis H53214 TaxID=1156417 RepID=A0A096BES0_9FIRM|nr:proline--tRNA ligase [Caloranaerobacter azorensis]KGG79655.1 prolyl-tRNA synthetase [Caloranaerobacter azorensis H53214]
MRMSRMYMPTLREVPSEAEIPSHQLLLRAGMIRKLVSGVYSFLPLGYRVMRKIEQIVREEMDAAGAQEVLMSAIQPAEIWQESRRWYEFGPEMFRLKDRHGREFCLGPTHEEYFTDLIRDEVKSYKQLPLNIYQIQTKYRDEKRPRFGLMRSREFLMKDAYSFDKDEEGMRESYKIMWKAYEKIFTRCGLKFKVVEGDSGAMGGSDSHEFMAMSDVGESQMAYCEKCDYAATDEKAKCIYNLNIDEDAELETEKIYTPNVKTIEQLVKFLNVPADKFVKTLIYKIKDEIVAVLVPGNREVNEVKLCNLFGVRDHELEMANEEIVKEVTGAEVGFAGPIGISEKVKLIVDSRVTQMRNFIVGANETDYHIKNVNYGRDFEGQVVEDLLLVEEGDLCPKCGEPLKIARGIEVGNIFQLGTKYSESLNATFLDENGKEKYFFMGSYGVGISRTMAAIIEQNYDEKGIIWPLSVAPYHVIITIVSTKKEEQVNLGEKLYKELMDKGIEVLLDDRNERPGVKFNDADLIGIPIRITVGRKASENIVEFVLRATGEKVEISSDEVYERIKAEFEKQGLKL